MRPRFPTLLVVAVLLPLATAQPRPASATVAVEVHSAALAPRADCDGSFVPHALDHVTRARGPEVTFYDSNGAGVAAGDLDDDGDLDLVFADLKGSNAIFWNEGPFTFRKQALAHGDSRAVNLVDVDGDGRLDIVFTQNLGALSYWRNTPDGFRREALIGVDTPTYSMAWGDLDADGDLDLVTASYDTLLEKELRDSFLFSSGAGVVAYENTPEGFVPTRLAERSQALALILFDLDADGRLDLVVGNDFEVPDYAFLNTEEGWREVAPFRTTTRNTMSFDAGDIDNDGRLDLFATDMKPDFGDESALAAWMPLMDQSYHRKTSGSVQVEENVLYHRAGTGFENRAYALGIDATGWSWSGRFGDLNNDGRLDLYVVNGMIARDVFAHLPGFELVEQNRAFRQTARGFVPAPEWGLGATGSGRGMILADLDNDGDLDVAINNLQSPSTVFENRLCGGSAVEVDLAWPAGANTRALGATVRLHTSAGSLTREVKSAGGYLSGDAARVHFGFPEAATLLGLEVVWPDGSTSEVADVAANRLYRLTRGETR